MPDKTEMESHLQEQVLQFVHRFSDISPGELEQLMSFCEIRQFDKKQVIVVEGEVDGYLNLVIRGLVRKYVRAGKNEVTLQLATEGHVIQSEVSFLTQTPSPVIVETLEPTMLVSISYANTQRAFEELPFAEKTGRQLLIEMFIKKDERYYDQLHQTTRQRFLDYVNTHPHMLQRVPQKILASYLNIKPETFSRLKHLLRKK